MNFKDLKELCKEHDEVLKNTETIKDANKERIWIKAETARGQEFYLGDEEKQLLLDYYNKRGLEIEKTIYNILNPQEEKTNEHK